MTVMGFVVRGAAISALLGAAVGLVLGLIANPPTAWFAVLEIGLPAAVAGAGIGLVFGLIVTIRRRVRMQRGYDKASEHNSIQPG